MSRWLMTTSVLAALLAPAPTALAQSDALLSAHGGVALPVVSPHDRRFGPGPSLGAALHLPLSELLLVGFGLDGTLLSDGDDPAIDGVQDPGMSTIYALTGRFRLRPLSGLDDTPSRATGLFLDFGAGAALTGEKVRPVFDATLGYGLAAGDVTVSPVVRWQTVFEVDNGLDMSPANTLFVGVQLTFFDAREAPPEMPALVDDIDGDRINDDVDQCPTEPEDIDAFNDDDGCPDLDNDEDGILDADDACHLEPEDLDDYADEDGCPDPDNDLDGFADADDHCPTEAEVVNGIDDHDGCPDRGLIELVHDHVILEEQVLFDFGRAELRNEAAPSLRALAELVHQHPEWNLVRVEGHADTRGAHAVNQRLSEARARAVMNALVHFGVPADHIEFVGRGENQPRARGDSEAEHALNRRVEFVVVDSAEVHTVVSPAREGGQEEVRRRNILRPGMEGADEAPAADEGADQ